jgi:hypothetical protein
LNQGISALTALLVLIAGLGLDRRRASEPLRPIISEPVPVPELPA